MQIIISSADNCPKEAETLNGNETFNYGDVIEITYNGDLRSNEILYPVIDDRNFTSEMSNERYDCYANAFTVLGSDSSEQEIMEALSEVVEIDSEIAPAKKSKRYIQTKVGRERAQKKLI